MKCIPCVGMQPWCSFDNGLNYCDVFSRVNILSILQTIFWPMLLAMCFDENNGSVFGGSRSASFVMFRNQCLKLDRKWRCIKLNTEPLFLQIYLCWWMQNKAVYVTQARPVIRNSSAFGFDSGSLSSGHTQSRNSKKWSRNLNTTSLYKWKNVLACNTAATSLPLSKRRVETANSFTFTSGAASTAAKAVNVSPSKRPFVKAFLPTTCERTTPMKIRRSSASKSSFPQELHHVQTSKTRYKWLARNSNRSRDSATKPTFNNGSSQSRSKHVWRR